MPYFVFPAVMAGSLSYPNADQPADQIALHAIALYRDAARMLKGKMVRAAILANQIWFNSGLNQPHY
jgi:hypothetical protein